MAASFQDGGQVIQIQLLRGTVQPYCVENEQVESFLVHVYETSVSYVRLQHGDQFSIWQNFI